jgi:HSP20 family protein
MRFHRRYEHPLSNIWKVMNDFNRLGNRMDRAFGRVHVRSAGVFPQLNVTEDADAYTVRAELPGIKSEDLSIEATAKSVTISGERKSDVEEGGRYHRRERESGKFSRVLGVPVEINPEEIGACMKNGVLVLTLPKAEAVKPRRITIN